MSEIVALVTVFAIIFVSLSTSITLFIIIYRRRQLNFKKTTEELKTNFHQQLLQSQLEMQEQTFNIISQEIHDNVGQALSLAKMQLNILERGDTLNKELVSDTRNSISKAMSDLRDIAKSLNTDRIQQLNLSEIMDFELARINRLGFITTNLMVEGKEQNIESQKKLIVFRIIQEALQNILKHSKASNININFNYSEDCLKIKVADNGKGFDKATLTKKDGLGLQNIINRAALIGGKADICSKVDEGTTITIITTYV